MNPVMFAVRRPITTLALVAAVAGGGVLGLTKMGVEIFPPPVTARLRACVDGIEGGARHAKVYLAGKYESYFHKHEEEVHVEPHKIVGTKPESKDVTITQEYVCQIHSQRHIDLCALESGYLEEINVREGQAVKKGDVLFRILPVLYKAKLDAEVAKANLAQMKYNYTKKLSDDKVVSPNELKLLEAELAEATAKADLARAELNFTNVKAPFDGIVDRLLEREGSLIKEGDALTTLSDNSVMWVYFNVPEKGYLEYMATPESERADQKIELELASLKKFNHVGKIGAIEAKFNNETGNIAFRADFPNPERLLRHGQTGKVLIHHVMKDALVIPQRATFENLAKQYVYVVDKDDVVHQREIEIGNVLDDIYVIKKGVEVGDRIVLEGARQIREGQKVEYEFREPEVVMANLKNKAE
ncbi:efflux RND transporter periplasmic adaptor subunit [Aquisphaera insulae]|uniref:efflux RND transporter periplasmic adaptor subunit n=1 Tax=Aquisphaera insulae TaxID=2712864 RepID=UPI0013EC2001|nr:efflux RND transporter periplasmic adaptor subunit [Aquisphaera insulae]